VLSVGSIEGRKNHLRLLEACEQLWQSGIEFKLQLIGTLQRQTGRAAHDKVRALQSAGHPVEYQGWLPDAQLVQAYAHCAFTIYPSLMEGFGFPIWESLRNGKACICSDRGATAEAARDGACLMVDSRSVDALAGAMRKLLQEPNTLAELNQIARARGSRSPTWSAHAKGLIAWMAELPVTPHPA
jgi:glycosyltransferase involved in cell wall biosynthesis